MDKGRVAEQEGEPTLLLVEDDAGMAAEIMEGLSGRGYSVRRVETAEEALGVVRLVPIAVLVLDRMLPGMDGLSLLSALRGTSYQMPAIVLSALSSVDERVKGLKGGGDDYLTKPFAMEELAARVEALLRRPTDPRTTVLKVGQLMVDLIERTAKRGMRELDLLPREFKLLAYLMRRPNQTATRAMLLEDVWNYKFVPQTNVVDVHIGKLRRKVDAPGEMAMIHNVPGVGFVLRSVD